LRKAGSWGGLFSQATRLVTGAMNSIDVNAAVESQGSYRVQHSYSASTISSTARRSTVTPDRSRAAETVRPSRTDTTSSGQKTGGKKRTGSRRKPTGDGSRQKNATGPG
jgi:hypothetical protein